jgi:hypothetical protein
VLEVHLIPNVFLFQHLSLDNFDCCYVHSNCILFKNMLTTTISLLLIL